MPGKYEIVMIRHGESEWNKLNKFCGWFDAELSDAGKVDLKLKYSYLVTKRPSRHF